MADNPTNQDSGGENIQVSRAEYDAMVKKSQRIDQLDELAKDSDLGAAEELIETLETAANNWLKAQQGNPPPATAPTPTPAAPAPVQQRVQQQPSGPDPLALKALIDGQFMKYERHQERLPEAERDGYTEDEIFRVINKQSQLVALIAREQTDGDFVKAAATILQLKVGKDRARAAGAADEKAKAAAAASATIGLGGRIAEPGAANTQDEINKQRNEEASRKIAGGRPYVYPGS